MSRCMLKVLHICLRTCSENASIVDNEFKADIYEMSRKIVELEDNFIDLAYAMGEPEGLAKLM